ADARARTRDVVAAVDGLDRGCVTAMDRTIAAVGLHHRWGEPSDSVFPPGSQTDAAPTMPQPTAEVGMGDRLLSCERIHLQASGGVVFRRPARPSLGTEDVPVGEKRKQYHKAYDYLRKRICFLDYCEYRRNHLPIGSGVTEAACKTVFTQR